MPKDYFNLGICVSESALFRAADEPARSTSPWKVLRYVFSILIVLAAAVATAQGQTCDYYAAPNGTGNGLSTSSPFKVQDFWSRAYAGRTLCLLDGTYSGYANMILPPQRLSGVAGAPITVRALNDGKVMFNGGYGLPPIQLYYNDWFVIDGFNACCSINSVVTLALANHNVIRRVVAWDSADGDNEIFGIHVAQYNTLEDIAAFGTARKVIHASQGGDHTTIRRAWARWDRSTIGGPKETFALAYNNYWLTCENCIGTWSGQGMPQTYQLRDAYGNIIGPTFYNYDVEQPQGIFTNDGEDGDKNAHLNLLGSLAYVLPGDNFKPTYGIFLTRLDSVLLKDVVVSIPSNYYWKIPVELVNLPGATNLSVSNATSQGGGSSYIENLWRQNNMFLGGAYASGENVFNTSRGANLCYRYQDGVRTTQPLWPWPMNQRIADALQQAGRSPIDVTATVQSLFGAIPSQCYGAGAPAPAPTPTPTPDPPPPSISTSGSITYRSSATANASGTSLTIPKPSGVVNGDVMVATVVWTKTLPWSGSITPPAGWTSRVVNTPYSVRMETFTKVASNEGAGYTFSLPSGSGVGAISAYQGVDNTNPLDVAAAGRNTGSTLVAAPSLTTVTNNAMLVSAFGSQGLDSWTAPSGETKRVDARDTTANSGWYSSVSQANVVVGSAGSTGTKTAVASVGDSDEIGQSIALRAAQ